MSGTITTIKCSCGKQNEMVYNCEVCHPKLSKAGYWQQCPICYGTGRRLSRDTTSTFAVCDVCNGKKIISTLTGQPPL